MEDNFFVAVGGVNTQLAIPPDGLDFLGRCARLQQARRVACLQGFCRSFDGVGKGNRAKQDLDGPPGRDSAVAHCLHEGLAVHGLRS